MTQAHAAISLKQVRRVSFYRHGAGNGDAMADRSA